MITGLVLSAMGSAETGLSSHLTTQRGVCRYNHFLPVASVKENREGSTYLAPAGILGGPGLALGGGVGDVG
mgnify:CR=1 FL=1